MPDVRPIVSYQPADTCDEIIEGESPRALLIQLCLIGGLIVVVAAMAVIHRFIQ